MTAVPPDLRAFLAGCPPLDTLDGGQLDAVVAATRVRDVPAGELVLDGFVGSSRRIHVVVEGEVALWYDPNRQHLAADDRFGVGRVIGFSSMLTGRPVGPRVVAHVDTRVAEVPEELVAPAFSTLGGARFLAEHVSHVYQLSAAQPDFTMVEDLIASPPLLVDPATPADEVARRMSEHALPCVVVRAPDGGYGFVTDAVLRRRVLADGLPASTPAGELMVAPAPSARLGQSAAEALIDLLDSPAGHLLVTDLGGEPRGVVAASDFAIAPTTAGVSTHELVRRAADVEELVRRSAEVPAVLRDVLERGLAASRVIAVHSAIVDTIVRRAITLVFAEHPELSTDWFTWLSLGSNGRREAVPGSDLDAAVAFDGSLDAARIDACRAAFGEVNRVLARCGISIDQHGASAEQPALSRTHAQWRRAARQWIRTPEEDQGVVMTCLLVDGRPIHGDPGLPEVNRVFTALRSQPGTMKLLLEESLTHRARLRPMRTVLGGSQSAIDLKRHALQPLVNIARWAALVAGSTDLHTPQRLRAAAGSAILPTEHAERLVEVFDALQDLRLRHQLDQLAEGVAPHDVLRREQVSRLDRGVLTEAVREIGAVQRRMERVAHYSSVREWDQR